MEYFRYILHFYSTKVLFLWFPTNIFKNLFLLSSMSSACQGTLCPFGHPQGMPQQEGDGEQVGGQAILPYSGLFVSLYFLQYHCSID